MSQQDRLPPPDEHDAWDGDLGPFYIMEEAERRSQLYRESGVLTREVLARVMAGEFWP